MIPGLDHSLVDGVWRIDTGWGKRQLSVLPDKGSGAATKRIVMAEMLREKE